MTYVSASNDATDSSSGHGENGTWRIKSYISLKTLTAKQPPNKIKTQRIIIPGK